MWGTSCHASWLPLAHGAHRHPHAKWWSLEFAVCWHPLYSDYIRPQTYAHSTPDLMYVCLPLKTPAAMYIPNGSVIRKPALQATWWLLIISRCGSWFILCCYNEIPEAGYPLKERGFYLTRHSRCREVQNEVAAWDETWAASWVMTTPWQDGVRGDSGSMCKTKWESKEAERQAGNADLMLVCKQLLIFFTFSLFLSYLFIRGLIC